MYAKRAKKLAGVIERKMEEGGWVGGRGLNELFKPVRLGYVERSPDPGDLVGRRRTEEEEEIEEEEEG